MGTTSSTQQQQAQDARHADLQFLAERFPFGDAELHRLYEAYLQIVGGGAERSTFLQDWAFCHKREIDQRKFLSPD